MSSSFDYFNVPIPQSSRRSWWNICSWPIYNLIKSFFLFFPGFPSMILPRLPSEIPHRISFSDFYQDYFRDSFHDSFHGFFSRLFHGYFLDYLGILVIFLLRSLYWFILFFFGDLSQGSVGAFAEITPRTPFVNHLRDSSQDSSRDCLRDSSKMFWN